MCRLGILFWFSCFTYFAACIIRLSSGYSQIESIALCLPCFCFVVLPVISICRYSICILCGFINFIYPLHTIGKIKLTVTLTHVCPVLFPPIPANIVIIKAVIILARRYGDQSCRLIIFIRIDIINFFILNLTFGICF